MTKTIYAVRHAKSSWSGIGLTDHQRPLNSRGKRDAPLMALQLSKQMVKPELIISSDAVRAYSTAQYFSEALLGSRDKMVKLSYLYHGSEDDFMDAAQEQMDTLNCIAIFGHNPGITYLANTVSSYSIDNVPTCGILHIESSAKHWADVALSNCVLRNFIYPKMF